MDDPFGLLQVKAPQPAEQRHSVFPRGAYLAVIAVLAVCVLSFGTIFLLQSRNQASADTISDAAATVALENLPSDVKSGQIFTANLIISNRGQSTLKDLYVLVQGVGVNLTKTIEASTNLAVDQPGYIRRLEGDEASRFDSKGDTGFYFYVGDLKGNQKKVQQIKAIVTSTSSSLSTIEAKALVPKTTQYGCGTLSLKTCQTQSGSTQIASGVFQITSSVIDKIKLNAGYNFISLPYVFTSSSMKEFLDSLKSKWAYIYRATTGEYLDLSKDQNASLIKPGVGFWVYDEQGGEYNLPTTKVATSVSETYTIPLDIGWNQIGNPYDKRMIWSADKITIKELADDGSESGTSYTLKTAIENGTLSKAFSVSRSSTDSSLGSAEFATGSTLPAFSGLIIKSTKKANLILPGREIIAAGDVISSEERTKIETWISTNGLNQYGDPNGTVYSGGNPLYNEKTAQTADRYDYIISKHPDRPWNI